MKQLIKGLQAVLNQTNDQSFVHNNTTHKARISTRQVRVNLDSFGWTNISACTLYCNTNMSTGDIITFENVHYRIMLKQSYGDNIYKYECEEKF